MKGTTEEIISNGKVEQIINNKRIPINLLIVK